MPPVSRLALTLLLTLGSTPAWAAPLKVNEHGALVIPRDVIKGAKVKAAANRTVCVQFPIIPGWEPGHTRDPRKQHDYPSTPPRLWVPVRKDGSALVPRTRLLPYNVMAPGTPGSTFTAKGAGDRLVLSRLSGDYIKVKPLAR